MVQNKYQEVSIEEFWFAHPRKRKCVCKTCGNREQMTYINIKYALGFELPHIECRQCNNRTLAFFARLPKESQL